MTCQELTELVTDYLEHRLSWRRRLEMQAHLGMCRRCRAYLRQMRKTVHALGELPPDPVPPDVQEALLERFRTWKP